MAAATNGSSSSIPGPTPIDSLTPSHLSEPSSSTLKFMAYSVKSRLGDNSCSLDDLPALLFRLKELSKASEEEERSTSICKQRMRVDREVESEKIREVIKGLLDFPRENEEDADFEDIICTRYQLGADSKEWLCCLDLLIAPSGEPFLSSSLIIDSIDKLWRTGFSSTPATIRNEKGHFTKWIDDLCTPSRLHTTSLYTTGFYIFLTLGMLMVPGQLIPYIIEDLDVVVVSMREIVWVVWTLATLISPISILSPTARWLLILTLITPLTFRAAAYNFLCFSVPFLSLQLISPSATSFPLQFPSLLPLASYINLLLGRVSSSSALLIPACFVAFVFLATALNGDIWRIGFQLGFQLQSTAITPEEPNIAPYPARMAIAVTLLIFLVLLILVVCSRVPPPQLPSSSDEWINKWGLESSTKARASRIRALNLLLVDKENDLRIRFPSRSSSPVTAAEESTALLPPSPKAPVRRIPFPTPFNLVPSILALMRVGPFKGTFWLRAVETLYYRSTLGIVFGLTDVIGRAWKTVKRRVGASTRR